MEQILLTLTPQEAASDKAIQKAVAREMRLPADAIGSWRIVKRSVDARQKNIKILLTIQAFLQGEPTTPVYEQPVFEDVHHASRTILIIGAGPAGLFAALTLLEKGIRPIVLERGKDVSSRKVDIALLNRNEGINAESNYCFGEGGAGTFSDGKLFSRSKKRGNMQRVLELFHYFGASDSILYETHAHIGSDKLPGIIRAMRECIIAHGGEIHFDTCVTSFDFESAAKSSSANSSKGEASSITSTLASASKNSAALVASTLAEEAASSVSVCCANGETYTAESIILAIGHSAHDTYRILHEAGVRLEPKGFAFGVRVEHPQALIDDLMYHHSPLRQQGLLPAANYALVAQVGAEKQSRGVYSFCMCPGGHIVPAGSTAESGIVNGMSASHRNSPFANSGIVVELHPEDLLPESLVSTSSNEQALACLEWQERVERLSWEHGAKAAGQPASAIAPAQRLKDFVNGKKSTDLPKTSYLPGCRSSRLDQWLPAVVGRNLQAGFVAFDKKYPGFLTNEAVILGVESRSSSPVRIPRDKETMRAFLNSSAEASSSLPLYPAGEGAGYAGGITSSAMDGIAAALAAASFTSR